MAKKDNQKKDPEVKIENALGKTENWLIRNRKILLGILIAAVAVALIIFGYIHLYKNPRQLKASAASFVAEQYFARDYFDLALNGDGANDGFVQVAEQYHNTAAGNMASHYAGICYLRLGDYDKAMEYLDKYGKVKGFSASIINAQNAGMKGDVYSQKGDYKNAAAMYEKAVKESDNILTVPMYLKKAGLVYEQLGDNAKALECYERISADYFNSLEGRNIDKYIGRVKLKLQ